MSGVVIGGTASGVGTTVAARAVRLAPGPWLAGSRATGRTSHRGQGNGSLVMGTMGRLAGDDDWLLEPRMVGTNCHRPVETGAVDGLREADR